MPGMKESNLVGKGGSFSQLTKSNDTSILSRTKKEPSQKFR